MRSVAAVIVNEHNEVLLQKRDNNPEIPEPGKWNLFGGHCEAGEEPEKTLQRELKEELDLNIESMRTNRKAESPILLARRNAGDAEEWVYYIRIKKPEMLFLREGETAQWVPWKMLGLMKSTGSQFGFGHDEVLSKIIL